MSIKDIAKKIKGKSLKINHDIFIIFSLILIGLCGFGLGKLSALEKSRSEIQITHPNTPAITNIPLSAAAMVSGESAKGLLVASKSGTKYHFPWCAGASQISEKNKIWFNSYQEAKNAGYSAAANCKGLE